MGARLARLLLVVLAALLCCGCAREDDVIELTQWTLVTPSGARHDVTLPARFSAEDMDVDGRIVLETFAEIPAAWRGRPLTLGVTLFTGSIELEVNGEPRTARDLGFAHSWRVDTTTGGEARPLAFRLEMDGRSTPWITVVPRLSATEAGDATYISVATFNLAAAVAGTSIIAALAVVYLILFLFDRRRAPHGWFALQAGTGAPIPVLFALVPRWLLPSVSHVLTALVFTAQLAALGFFFSYFRRPLPRRALLFAVSILTATVAWSLVAGTRGGALLDVGVLTALEAYAVAILLKEYRAGRERLAAGAFAAGFSVLTVAGVPSFCLLLGQPAPADGVLGTGVSFTFYGVLQALVLGRDHIRSLREAEARVKELEERERELEARSREVGQLNEELRHQVAERSRELTEALARSEGSVAPAALAVGDVFDGRYAVTGALGRGGMGAVYEVERTRDGKRLALKVVTGAMSTKQAARFAREAEIGARVQHANLVSIVDVGIAAGATPFLVMELVQGGSLEDRRARFGDAARARPIVRQIAAGLAELHANRVVHRDLKPGNVLLVEGNGAATPVAKISDFGISRFGALDDSGDDVDVKGATVSPGAHSPSPRDLTETGALMGTPVYMPPEAWFGPARHPSADVFSFGVLAYEALTGRSPFAVPAVLLVRARQPIPTPAPLDGVDAKVASLILACLRAEPSERPRASELGDQL